MNPEVKKRWVEALRSGKYKQGKAALKTLNKQGESEYCCLGVLCDLYDRGKWSDDTRAVGSSLPFKAVFSYFVDGHQAELILPRIVAEWAGLESRDPEVLEGRKLSQLNDGFDAYGLDVDPASFEEIAKLIEDKL